MVTIHFSLELYISAPERKYPSATFSVMRNEVYKGSQKITKLYKCDTKNNIEFHVSGSRCLTSSKNNPSCSFLSNPPNNSGPNLSQYNKKTKNKKKLTRFAIM